MAAFAEDRATIVWDRHDLLYAYGPLEKFTAILREAGFTDGVAAIPSPHVHTYHPEFHQDAAAVMKAFPWSTSPLRPEDEQ